MKLSCDIYLTDKCNMNCKYCYHKNYGKYTMSYSKLRSAIDYFLRINCDSIGFLGGEPLMAREILEKIIKYIRYRSKAIRIAIYTNGVFLEDEIINFLNQYNVNKVFLSLDGNFKTYIKNRGINSLSRLENKIIYENILLKGSKIKKSAVLLYLNNESQFINNLVENIVYFNKKNFNDIALEFERHCFWDNNNLFSLAKQSDLLCNYLKSENNKIYIMNIKDTKERYYKIVRKQIWWGDCDKLILGEDGNYYICDRVFRLPIDTREIAKIGNIKEGIDFEKRKRLYQEAYNYISSNINDSYWYYYCPMGTYFLNKWLNRRLDYGLDNLLAFSKFLYSFFYRIGKYAGEL